MYVGQKITLQMRATDPVTLAIVTDATGTAYLFAPPKNPQANPGDRTPDATVAMTFDPVSRYYLATVDTTGFSPGAWWLQGQVQGGANAYDGWNYISFTLDA